MGLRRGTIVSMQRAGWSRLTVLASGLALALGLELISFVEDRSAALTAALVLTFLALVVSIAMDALNRLN
jgi:hypothetical protein